MANINLLVPHILRWEGGFVDHPLDRGGATNKGVTLATFRAFYGAERTVDDLKAITTEQWTYILRRGFWDVCGADGITSQDVANTLVDWAWGSGARTTVKEVQRLIGTTPDGIAGPKTLRFINAADPRQLFDDIQAARERFYRRIVERNPSQSVFLRGWLNRLNALKFGDYAE